MVNHIGFKIKGNEERYVIFRVEVENTETDVWKYALRKF